jgi:uncharacterized protein (TIGR04222 family)
MLVVILVDRGFVNRDGTKLTADATNAGYLTNDLEIAVFNYFRSGQHPSGVFKDPAVRAAGDSGEEALENLGLWVPRPTRTRDCLVGIVAVGGVAALRIALSGPPFQFLLIETAGLALAAVWVSRQGMNARGLRVLNQLRERVSSGDAPSGAARKVTKSRSWPRYSDCAPCRLQSVRPCGC